MSSFFAAAGFGGARSFRTRASVCRTLSWSRRAVFLQQPAHALGLLHGVQVLPLQVLHQGQHHGLPVVRVHDPGGKLAEACHTGGPPAPFPGDDLVVVPFQAADRDGLDDAVAADGIRQGLQLFPVEALAGLMLAGFYLADGQTAEIFLRGGQVTAEKGVQPAAQAFFRQNSHLPLGFCAMISSASCR